MAARVILEYPDVNSAFSPASATFTVLLGTEEIGTLEHGETKTFECKGGEFGVDYGVGLDGFRIVHTNRLEIEDGFEYYIMGRYNWWLAKWSLEIIKTNPLTESGEALEGDTGSKPLYSFTGTHGKSIVVYADKCVITTKPTFGSFVMGNATDGEKTVFYADCNGVQYKAAGIMLGYIQLETASGMMNNRSDNFASENSFTFESDLNSKAKEVYEYINSRIAEIKSGKNGATQPAATTVIQQVSAADEIKKFKELLDMGAITQEEFDEKKKQLLVL